jgi:regulator of protease activity HflC (stomatin/prohibitin superfamily)
MESNTYLDQVVQQQAKVAGELRARQQMPLSDDAAAVAKPRNRKIGAGEDRELSYDREDEESAPIGSNAIDYRITGRWWKTVVVPPNAYVVHTRRGVAEPVHMGLGISFPYDPYTDAFLVIPAAVQTLLINARCISAERQGVLVQAYVQWVIDDLKTAYRRLDFSDASDPMRIVNVQLREQAEAAIKDKVATMPIDDILSDKQPIIEELTLRLRAVAEGGGGTAGLGLKIVTVQIKEAVVSSTRLWENLQKPFRADRERQARLAELEAARQVAEQERLNREAREAAELESNQAKHKREQEAEKARIGEEAETQRARRQAEEALAVQAHQLEAAKAARELEAVHRQVELERARAELETLRREREDREHAARVARESADVEILRKRRGVENEWSEGHVKAALIARLPEIAAAMPRPEELRQITVAGDGGNALTGLVAQLLGVIEGASRRNGQA